MNPAVVVARALRVVVWSVALAAVPALAQPAKPTAERVDWTDIKLLDGRTMAADELRGRTVVVQVWASWCPFCALQNPHVQKLYDEWRGRGLRVLAFSIDRDQQAPRDYLNKNGYTFPVAMHSAQVDRWFGARRTLPETYVVDPTGKIVFVHRGEMFAEDIAALSRFIPRQG